MATETIKTKDPDTIKRWVEARGGRPAVVEGTETERAGGVLRIDFGVRDDLDENLREVSWSDFFRTFAARGLRFAYAEETEDGSPSRFCRFVWS